MSFPLDTDVLPKHASRPEHRRVRRGVLWWVTTIALVLVSAFALLTVVIPLALGAHTYTVLTGSMRPGLEPGSLIAVREVPVDEIRVGDVITYQLHPGEPAVVTHRVVSVQKGADGESEFTTRGDANNTVDPTVIPVQIRGVVVYAVPWLGYPNLLISGTTRSTAVIVFGVIVIVYGASVLLVDLLRHRRLPR